IELRRDEQIYVDADVIVPIDAVRELRVLLDARPGAAPERVVLGVERLPYAGCEGEVILRGADVGTDRADAVVQQQALVIVEILCARSPAVEMPRTFEHVVGAAALGGVRAGFPFRRELPRRRQPSFRIAGTSRDVGSRAAHLVKEVGGDVVEPRVAR